MVPVGYGVADEYGNGYLYSPVHLEVFSELDEGEKELALGVCVLRKDRVAQPRQARHGAEVGWLSGACLDDARHVPVRLDVRYNGLIERVEIFAVFAPNVGERLGLRVEKRVGRHDLVPAS